MSVHTRVPEATPAGSQSPLVGQVRRFDRDRFVTALFAPPARRMALLALYAFNIELATIRENAREPLAGMVRLQWWREVVEGRRPPDEIDRHPVAGPVRALMAEGIVPADLLTEMVEARESDVLGEPFPDLPALEAYAAASSGALTAAALTALGCADAPTVARGRRVGTAFALVGLARALPFQAAMGRVTLPLSLLAEAGGSAEDVLAGRMDHAGIARVVRQVGERAGVLLAEARSDGRVARGIVPALLPATLATLYLRRLARSGWDVFDAGNQRVLPAPLRLIVQAALGRF